MESACRRGVVILLVLGFCLSVAARVDARRRGGGSNATQRRAIQQQLAYQRALALAEKEKDQEVLDRFDTNKNGKIDPTEKTGWDRYWREVRLGNTPHPYSTITAKEVKAILAGKSNKKPATGKTTTSMASAGT